MPTMINKPIDDSLSALLTDSSESLLIVDPSSALIERLVEVATDTDDLPELRLLAREEILKDAADDFLVASNSADLIDSEVLSVRTGKALSGNQLFVTEDELTVILVAGDAVAALSTDDKEFVAQANDYYDDVWERAEPYSLRTPALSRIQESLLEEIGPDIAADFDAVLESLETARGGGDGLDEVTITLLVAAKNEELLYDISKWGEDVGIASKATFSRTKTTLEDLGLIDTEKVPINVGRPRLRLKFGHERLDGVSADELASVTQGLMT